MKKRNDCIIVAGFNLIVIIPAILFLPGIFITIVVISCVLANIDWYYDLIPAMG